MARSAHDARALLQQILDYPIDAANTDALRLQLLAAKALLKLNASREPSPVANTPGQSGGLARANSLSPEQRQMIAKKAAQTRWKTA